MGPPVVLELTGDEALVLFDWLGKLDALGLVRDTAERRVLEGVEAALERVLVDPFAADYPARVEAARRRVAGP